MIDIQAFTWIYTWQAVHFQYGARPAHALSKLKLEAFHDKPRLVIDHIKTLFAKAISFEMTLDMTQ